MSILYIFDLFGTFAFAVSGALLGLKKEMDIYGMFVLAISTGVGGGTLRDILLGRTPPFVLVDINYVITIFIATIFVFFLNSIIKKDIYIKALMVADAVGLGVFTCIGNSIALTCDAQWYAIILCGVITATAGGMFRDILAGEVPFVLRKEIYASASIAGGICFLLLDKLGVALNITILIASILVILIRLLAIYKNWNLPGVQGEKSWKN